MQQWWIPARDAFDAIAKENPGGTAIAICSRAAEALLKTRARVFITEKGRSEDALIPNQFWWAKGQSALEQNWNTGDFVTWINRTYEWKAFGVEFDFAGLKQMLPPEQAAEFARRASVVGDSEWISAREARQFTWEKLGANPTLAGDVLIQHVKLEFVPGRAVLMQMCSPKNPDDWQIEEREWDIPDWFWNGFVEKGSSAQDWAQGKFSGTGMTPKGRASITLTGVHFSLPAMQDIASPVSSDSVQKQPNRGGRPPKDWWDDLWCAVWGEVYRGDLKPKSQADIERAMMNWVIAREESVSESTLKPLARRMFVELER
jgi:hypothetical protein